MVTPFTLRSVKRRTINHTYVIGEKEREKKMTDREMEDMLDEIFRKVFKEDW